MSQDRAQLLAELDQMVREPAGEPDAARMIELVDAIIDAGEPIESLVERYAAADAPLISRVMSFVVARRASRGPTRAGLAAPVWRMAERLRDDDSTRINLLTAVQLLAAYDVLLATGDRPPEVLISLLVDSLDGSVAVQETVVPVITTLHAHGLLARLPSSALGSIAQRLDALKEADNELLREDAMKAAGFVAAAR